MGDPGAPAVVSGSWVKSGSNVVGSLRSSSKDRESIMVNSQSPDSLLDTSAGKTAKKAGMMYKMAETTSTPTNTYTCSCSNFPKSFQ